MCYDGVCPDDCWCSFPYGSGVCQCALLILRLILLLQ